MCNVGGLCSLHSYKITGLEGKVNRYFYLSFRGSPDPIKTVVINEVDNALVSHFLKESPNGWTGEVGKTLIGLGQVKGVGLTETELTDLGTLGQKNLSCLLL